MPAAKILVSRVNAEKFGAKLESVSFPNNTLKWRVDEMLSDVAK